MEELLAFSMEARRRVREHILRIDDTFKRHDFKYRRLDDGHTVTVLTPEEIQYPTFAGPRTKPPEGERSEPESSPQPVEGEERPNESDPEPSNQAQTGHTVVPENTKGWSYRKLFAQHLRGAKKITIADPYVRQFFQARNIMELLQMIHDLVPEGDEAEVHLITQSDPDIRSAAPSRGSS